MDKASGVYLTLTDNSIVSSGADAMKYVIPMLTTKGELGLNRVTADTMTSIIGYDLKYNSNYYGLSKLLSTVSYVDVWRINQDTKLANLYLMAVDGEVQSDDDVTTFDEITHKENVVFAAAGATPGDYGKLYIKMTPEAEVITVPNNNANSTDHQVVVIPKCNKNEIEIVYKKATPKTGDNPSQLGWYEFGTVYDAVTPETGDNPKELGWYEYDDVGQTYVLSDDTEVDPNKTYYTATEEYFLSQDTEVSSSKTYYIRKDILTSISIYNSTNDLVVGAVVKESDNYFCYKVINDNITDSKVGELTFDEESNATIDLTVPFSTDSFWNFRVINAKITEWKLTVAEYDEIDETYSIINEYVLSTNSKSEIFWEKLDFGQVQIYINPDVNISAHDATFREYIPVKNGDNGKTSAELSAADIDVNVLDKSDANILLMNGLGTTSDGTSIVNRIASKCIIKKIHLHADAPAFADYIRVQEWAKKIVRSEYVVICSRPDQSKLSDGSTIFIYPSISYGMIYASMYANYGSLNYPPAGPTYGNIAVENLIDCDYEMYKDELKTNRINWQRSNNLGTMMWEQRTTYALNSDLSYIAPTFIVDSLSEQLVNFEQNFSFRYMTPDDLFNQQSGLTTILNNFVNSGFIYRYDMKFPTYAEAQASGRTITIKISVVITKDSEVINIDLVLANA